MTDQASSPPHPTRPHPTRRGISRWWALVALALVVALNEWTLGHLFAADGSIGGTKLWIVRGFDACLVLVALAAGSGRFSPLSFYRDAALIAVNTFLFVAVINIVAMAGTSHWAMEFFYSAPEFVRTFPDKAREIWDDPSTDAILTRIYSAGADGHPSLPLMMRPVSGEAYNTGPRGERVSCRAGSPIDTPLDGSVWMFGGSTTFGTGVNDCETIASALNEQAGGTTFVNLGVESFTRNAEVERLVLLLRQGFRPKAVLFLDGLNDIDINVLRAPLLPPHTVGPTVEQSYYHQVLNRNEVFASNLVGRMPLLSKLADLSSPDVDDLLPCTVAPFEAGIEARGNDYVDAPLAHLGRQAKHADAVRLLPADALPEAVLSSCADRAVTLYTTDQAFLEGLGATFGFEVVVFFQPLGILNPANPHVRDPARMAGLGWRRFIEHVSEAVRAEIAAGRLGSFVDLSDMGRGCAICYVDANHYSPALNREIAAAMLAATRARGIAFP